MLCPAGFQETLVCGIRNGKTELLYRGVIIPRKDKREAMRRESIRVADAVKLAKRIRAY
jgi:hypothetical protein